MHNEDSYTPRMTTTATTPVLSPNAFGFVTMTPGIIETFGDRARDVAQELFVRFLGNDWGTTPDEDQELNAETIKAGNGRVMASYLVEGTKVWVISYITTDPKEQLDCNVCNTCVMLPSDY